MAKLAELVTSKAVTSAVVYPRDLATEAKIRPFRLTGVTQATGYRQKPVYDFAIEFRTGDKATLRMSETKHSKLVAEHIKALDGFMIVVKRDLVGDKYTWELADA